MNIGNGYFIGNTLIQPAHGMHHSMLRVATYAKLVEVRIEFISIGEVDTMNEKFQAQVKVTSRWYDDEEIDVYDKSKHWNPKLFIENALDIREEIDYYVDRFNNKSIVTEVRYAKGSFWEKIELEHFPIDIQELNIILATRYKPSRVKLIADTEKISTIHSECLKTFRDQQKWKLYKCVQTSETASYDLGSTTSLYEGVNDKINNNINPRTSSPSTNLEQKSKFVATCKCSRRPQYFLINCYLFVLLFTLLSLTLFTFEPSRTQNRISGTFTLILTSVSFKWVTNRFVPAISYLTSLDRYQMFSICFLVLCCIWHATIAFLSFDFAFTMFIDKVVLILFAILFISIQFYFVVKIKKAFQKIKALKRFESDFVKQYGLEDSDDDEY